MTLPKRTQVNTLKNDLSPSHYEALVDCLIDGQLYPDLHQQKDNNKKIVLVLGAGASYWSGLKSWGEMKKPILKSILKFFKDKDQFISEIWTILSSKIGIKPDLSGDALFDAFNEIYYAKNSPITLEDICSIAGKTLFLEKAIRKLLKVEYGYKPRKKGSQTGYPPQLGYELIAHLVKHDYVNHIITFNFDEALDTALENELGVENFCKIISDKQIIPSQIGNKPCLIKLHGSVNSPESLRFTKEFTSVMSDEMISILDTIILKETKCCTDVKKINLVSLGYSWSDKDFVNWIDSRRDFIESVFVYKWSTGPVDSLTPLKENGMSVNYLVSQVLSPDYSLGIDQFIWALCSSIEEKLTENKIPFVTFSRHLVRGQIFGPNYSDEDLSGVREGGLLHDHSAYRLFYVEFYLYLVRCRGMYNYSALSNNSRIHRYFQYFKNNSDFKSQFERILSVCKIEPAPDLKETFISKFSREELVCSFNEIGLFLKGVEIHVPQYDYMKRMISVNTNVLASDFWKEHMQKMIEGPEIEILPGVDPHSEWIFKSPKPLDSYLAFNTHTERIIKKDWSHFLMIAETGEWMFCQEDYIDFLNNLRKTNSKDKDILLIRAKSILHWNARRDIDKKINLSRKALAKLSSRKNNSIINSTVAGLNWFEHNRHMSLAINIEGTNIDEIFKGGIYFERRMKATRISPVYVEQADCLELFSTFCSYTYRIYSGENSPKDLKLLKVVLMLCEKLEVIFKDNRKIKRCYDLLKKIKQ